MALNNAHDFAMRDPIFNTHIYQNHRAPLPTDPAQILLQAQAVEALHTSATVEYISKCHPTTREEVTEDIMEWVVRAAGADQGSAPRKAILWFSGPAGGGKTSIMRGVVDRCATTRFSTLSFFFSIRGSGVTTVRPFVPTIIHQLVALHPVLRPIIYNIIQDRPTIFEESLEFQIERVLVGALQSPAFRSQSSPLKIVFAIDGLDECREERERQHLLDALHALVTKLPRLIVVIVASRPEFDLRRAFDDPKLSSLTEPIKLHKYDGSNDIRVFVTNEIKVIRQSHPLRGSIPEGWQPEEIIKLLVDKSSGNFIIPSTAMKYIRTSRRNPVDSLNIIVGLLKNPSPTSKPFAELDALYAHILNPPEADPSLIKRILHCIISFPAFNTGFLSSSFLDDFLKLPPGTTATTLCDLHSVLHIPESKGEAIKFHHKTLEDYLLDPERSSDFFQSPYKTHLDLAMLCATHLTRWGNNPVVDTSLSIIYSVHFWGDHLKSCIDQKPVSATPPDIIMDLDPRNAMMWKFIHSASVLDIPNNLAKALHAALCSKRHCVRLCQFVTRINNCEDKCDAFRETFEGNAVDGRFNALSRFKSETGLFAPLDADSRVVFNMYGRAQLVRGGRLADGDEDGQADTTGTQMDDSGRSAIGSREGRPSSPGFRGELFDGEANCGLGDGGGGGNGGKEEEGGESGDHFKANTTTGRPSLGLKASWDSGRTIRNSLGRTSNPPSRQESLVSEANASTIPPPPAASDDEGEDVRPEASPSPLPPPPDNNLEANITGGLVGGFAGSAIAAGDRLGHSGNPLPRRESLGAEASPSTSPRLAPSAPPHFVSRPSWWHHFTS